MDMFLFSFAFRIVGDTFTKKNAFSTAIPISSHGRFLGKELWKVFRFVKVIVMLGLMPVRKE